MKRTVMLKKVLSLVFCGPFVLAIFLCLICTARNNQKLKDFAKQLYDYELPQETEIVETHLLCGNLYGVESSMDYAAMMLIKTSQNEKDIKSYYFKAGFNGVDNDKVKPAIEIIPVEGQRIKPYYIENQSVQFSKIKDRDDEEGYMVIVMTDIGHKAFFDLRSRAE